MFPVKEFHFKFLPVPIYRLYHNPEQKWAQTMKAPCSIAYHI